MNTYSNNLTSVLVSALTSLAIGLFPLQSLAQDAHAATTPVIQAEVSDTDSNDIGDQVRALLIPHRQAVISSQVAARIQSIHVQEGDRFKQDDILISFSCDAQAASLRSALAKQKQYQLTHDANIELRKDDAVSKLDVALSEAKLEESKANVAYARVQQRKCQVVAPYDGRVAKVEANEHESAEIGAALITILDDSQLEITLHLPSAWITSVSKDDKFKVSVDETGKTYDASVIRVSPKIDPTSRTFEVTAQVVGQQDDLLAGMSGDAHFNLNQ